MKGDVLAKVMKSNNELVDCILKKYIELFVGKNVPKLMPHDCELTLLKYTSDFKNKPLRQKLQDKDVQL
jgi:hypothetical protein